MNIYAAILFWSWGVMSLLFYLFVVLDAYGVDTKNAKPSDDRLKKNTARLMFGATQLFLVSAGFFLARAFQ